MTRIKLLVALAALAAPLLALAGPANADEPEVVKVFITGSSHFHENDKKFNRSGYALPGGLSYSGAVTCNTVNGGIPIDENLPGGEYPIDISSCSGLSLVGENAANYVLQLVNDSPFTVYRAGLTVTTSATGTITSLLAGKMTYTTKVVERGTTTPVAGIQVDITYNPTIATTYRVECSALTDANGIAKCSVPPTKIGIFGFTFFAKGPGNNNYNGPYAEAKVPFA